MKLIVSDVHLHNWSPFSHITSDGVNSRLQTILDALDEATQSIGKGDTLYITGDLFHVRGHIQPSVMNPTLELFKKIIARKIKVRIIPGNHDLESKNTTKLTNALQALEAVGCEIVNELTVFEDEKVVMVPWVDSLDDLRHIITDVRMDLGDQEEDDPRYTPQEEYTLMIHAALNGVISIPDSGLDAEELEDLSYKEVFCGHYHNHKSFEGDVYSVGALTHQTWSDVGTVAGYILVHDSGAITHQSTSAPKFVDYDDEWSDEEALDKCEGNYVRVKLGQVTEKEIREIRECIESDYKALGVIVKSIPTPVGVTRTASIGSGASIETSISDWVKTNIPDDIKKEVSKSSLKILQEIDCE